MIQCADSGYSVALILHFLESAGTTSQTNFYCSYAPLYINAVRPGKKKTDQTATRTKYGANLFRPCFCGFGWQLQEHNLMGAKTWQAPSHPALVEIHAFQVPTSDSFSIDRTYVPLGPLHHGCSTKNRDSFQLIHC